MILAILTSCGRESASLPDPKGDNEIRRRTKEFVQAFNAKDSDKLASFWAEDALYTNPLSGDTAEGRQAIAEYYRKKFSEVGNSELQVAINNVEFPEANRAIATGQFQLILRDQPPIKSAFKAEYRKEQGEWFLDHVGEMEIQQAPSNFEHLKDLSWMIGKWIDEDDSITITF
jgi:uncharacterized protein (TIGR02246 family)